MSIETNTNPLDNFEQIEFRKAIEGNYDIMKLINEEE